MRHILSLGASLAVFWLLLSGSLSFDHKLVAIFGVLSVILCVYLALRMDRLDSVAVHIRLGPTLVSYWFWLAREIGKANIEVARIVLSPKMKISPRLIRVRAEQQTDVGITTFANSITLTPGTVSIEIEDRDILVHAITEDMARGAMESDMGDRVTAMELKYR